MWGHLEGFMGVLQFSSQGTEVTNWRLVNENWTHSHSTGTMYSGIPCGRRPIADGSQRNVRIRLLLCLESLFLVLREPDPYVFVFNPTVKVCAHQFFESCANASRASKPPKRVSRHGSNIPGRHDTYASSSTLSVWPGKKRADSQRPNPLSRIPNAARLSHPSRWPAAGWSVASERAEGTTSRSFDWRKCHCVRIETHVCSSWET